MKRTLFLALLLLPAAPGCRRHTPKDEKREDPSHLVVAPESGKIAIDEGCPHSEDGQCSHGTDSPSGAGPDGASAGRFGKPLGASPRVELASILSRPKDFHEKRVRVDGHVSRACSRKGCWMELAVDESEEAARCRVTFENYGFFVPRDSAGSHARLEGVVQVTKVQPDAVRHYESEGGKFPSKQPDGSAQEVRLIATGVELERI